LESILKEKVTQNRQKIENHDSNMRQQMKTDPLKQRKITTIAKASTIRKQ